MNTTENEPNDATGTDRTLWTLLIVTATLSLLGLAAGAGTASAMHQIDSCADDVTSPGLHEVNSSISNSTASSCIDITASDVVLEGNGNSIDGVDQDGSSFGIDVFSQTNVTVRNLTVTNWETGVQYDDVDDGNIIDVNAITNDFEGIALLSSDNNDVTANNVTGTNFDGIFLDSSSNNNNVTNNDANGNGRDGIRLDSSNGNNVTENDASGNDADGIVLVSSSDDNDITANNASGNTDGIDLTSSDGNNVTANEASDNDDDGIDLAESSNNDVTANEVKDNADDGINLDSSSNDNNVSANDVSENADEGINLESSSNSNEVTKNDVTGNSDDGIRLESSSDNIVSGNDITDSGANGTVIDDGTNVTLENNDITSVGLTSFPNADAIRLLGSSSDITVTGGSIDLSASGRNGVQGFGLGYSSVTNLTVENVDMEGITTGVNIQNGGGSIVRGNNITNSGANGVSLTGSPNLVIENNIIETAGTGNTATEGIFYDGDNVNVTDNVVDGVQSADAGISDSPGSSDAVISNNTVKNVQGGDGIFLRGSDSLVKDNTVTNAGENGIRLDSSDNNDFIDNTAWNNGISDFRIDGSSGNVVENLDIGASTAPNTTLDFTGNNFELSGNSTPPADPAGEQNISRFIEATNTSASGSFLNLTFQYEAANAAGVDESSLDVWRNDGTWTELGGTVDTAANEVSYNITNFGSVFAPLAGQEAVSPGAGGECIDRRNLSRGQESQECPRDRTLSRGESRRDLDRETGRGGGSEQPDSTTSRRDRSRSSRGR